MTFWLPADKPLTDGSRVITASSLGREGGWQLRHGYHDGQRWMQADHPTEGHVPMDPPPDLWGLLVEPTGMHHVLVDDYRRAMKDYLPKKGTP